MKSGFLRRNFLLGPRVGKGWCSGSPSTGCDDWPEISLLGNEGWVQPLIRWFLLCPAAAFAGSRSQPDCPFLFFLDREDSGGFLLIVAITVDAV